MVVAPWVKLKTERGKKACIYACGKHINLDSINYDDMAAAFPGVTFNPDNIKELQNKYLEGLNQDQTGGTKTKKAATKTESKKIAATKTNKSESKTGSAEKTGTKKRGRPCKDGIPQHEIRNKLLKEKNADSFLLVNTDKTTPEILSDTELYSELLKDTVKQVYDSFLENYPEKTKKHPSIWFKHLCLLVKQNTPKIDNIQNYKMIEAAWDIYAALCLSIGINRTLENFQIFSGLNWNVMEKIRDGSSPECIELSKKIYSECRSDIVGGLGTSFGSSPNQMFIAKAVYGLAENTVITHVSANEIKRKLDDIPTFNIECDSEK